MSSHRHTRERAKDVRRKRAETGRSRPAQNGRKRRVLSDVGTVTTLRLWGEGWKGGFRGAGIIAFFSWALDIQVHLVRENSAAVHIPQRIFFSMCAFEGFMKWYKLARLLLRL